MQIFNVQTPLMQSFPVPHKQPPGLSLSARLAGGHVPELQQVAAPAGFEATKVQIVPPPPQTLLQQSLFIVQEHPPENALAPAVPPQPQVAKDAAFIAEGAVIDEIIGKAIIEANPILLTISRRFKPSKGVMNSSALSNKLSFFS